MTAKRQNVGALIARMATLYKAGKSPTPRMLELLALSLERDGDVAQAAEVREILTSKSEPQWMVLQRQQSESGLKWFEPADVEHEQVLHGPAKLALERFATECAHASAFVAAGLDAPTRALFVGPSGTGKTLAARWLGWKLGLPVAAMALDQTVKIHMGETAAQIAKNIEAAGALPCVLFLDEIDGCSADRSGSDETGAGAEMRRTTSALLQRLDWLPPAQIVIAATNVEDKVDGAIRRRLPLRIEFGLPDLTARKTMVGRWLAKADVDPDLVAQLAAQHPLLAPAALRAEAMALGRRVVMERLERPLRQATWTGSASDQAVTELGAPS